jgi:site-specific DNA-methyltransferase (cytosine-N4-specific)
MRESENPSSLSDLRARLLAVDWNFTRRGPRHQVDGIHPYPAKFIAELPRQLLAELPLPAGSAVLDPFCGSGTTLTESQRRGLPCLGIDLNPIACLISRVKTAPAPRDLEQAATRVVATARQNRSPAKPAIPHVDHWFKLDVQQSVAALVEAIRGEAVAGCREALSLALSSILVRVSNQDSDTRYAAVPKTISGPEVFALFLAACRKVERALQARDWPLAPAAVLESDSLAVRPTDLGRPVGLVITSPPYPNAYEYWLYHKYRMWWLGFDPLRVKAREIGARAHFFERPRHTSASFWTQMRQVFALIDAVLVKTGFACFVIGRSVIHGDVVSNADILQTLAQERGLQLVARIERVLAPQRKSFNLAHAKIKTESVLVFQKE